MAQLWASFESFAQPHKQIVVSQHMTRALKFFKRFIELFERFAFVDELRIAQCQHLLHRADFVDHHAEDRSDSALARKMPALGELHLPSQKVYEILRIALIKHGKVAINSRLRGVLS